jgi:hypothetical protein
MFLYLIRVSNFDSIEYTVGNQVEHKFKLGSAVIISLCLVMEVISIDPQRVSDFCIQIIESNTERALITGESSLVQDLLVVVVEKLVRTMGVQTLLVLNLYTVILTASSSI